MTSRLSWSALTWLARGAVSQRGLRDRLRRPRMCRSRFPLDLNIIQVIERRSSEQRSLGRPMRFEALTGLEPAATTGGEAMTSTTEHRERLAAHERLSTGALASWMRACARHPWRVVLTWLGIIVALIFLVAHRRRQPEGRVLDSRLGHTAGDRPHRGGVRRGTGRCPEPRLRRAAGRAARHARAQGRHRGGDREAPDRRVRSYRRGARRRRRRHQRRRPLRSRTRSPTTGGSRTRRRSSTA